MTYESYDAAWARAKREGQGFHHTSWGWVGPNKLNKGMKGGACNVTACQDEPAHCFNTVMNKFYCEPCARGINKGAIATGMDPFVNIPEKTNG